MMRQGCEPIIDTETLRARLRMIARAVLDRESMDAIDAELDVVQTCVVAADLLDRWIQMKAARMAREGGDQSVRMECIGNDDGNLWFAPVDMDGTLLVVAARRGGITSRSLLDVTIKRTEGS